MTIQFTEQICVHRQSSNNVHFSYLFPCLHAGETFLTVKPWNLHTYIIFIKKYWEDKRYYVPPAQKLWGTCPSSPPINSVPGVTCNGGVNIKACRAELSRACASICSVPLCLFCSLLIERGFRSTFARTDFIYVTLLHTVWNVWLKQLVRTVFSVWCFALPWYLSVFNKREVTSQNWACDKHFAVKDPRRQYSAASYSRVALVGLCYMYHYHTTRDYFEIIYF